MSGSTDNDFFGSNGNKEAAGGTVTMFAIAMELFEETKDEEFKRLERILDTDEITLEEMTRHRVLSEEKYNFDNYYRNILRYCQHIFSVIEENTDQSPEQPRVSYKTEDGDYKIPVEEVWLLKTLLRQYSSPFMKNYRLKKFSKIPYDIFEQFVQSVETAIKTEIGDPAEQLRQLSLLNKFTFAPYRKVIRFLRKKIEDPVSLTWKEINRIQHPQLRTYLFAILGIDITRICQDALAKVRQIQSLEDHTLDEMNNRYISSIDKGVSPDVAGDIVDTEFALPELELPDIWDAIAVIAPYQTKEDIKMFEDLARIIAPKPQK